MLKSQRQVEILNILKSEDFITVSDLAERLYASQPTVRRDLSALESEGYVRRCHGGAMLNAQDTRPPIYFRREKNAKEKARMCAVAAELISDGDVIFVDASSTVFHLADHIDKKSGITVITNGHFTAERFAEQGATVYSTGGKLIMESMVYAGTMAERTVESYNADIMFYSVASLSDEGVLSDWSDEERSVRVVMSRNARKRVFMCDSTKFGKSSAFKLFALSSNDYIVTDAPLPEKLVSLFNLEAIRTEPAYLYALPKREKKSNK